MAHIQNEVEEDIEDEKFEAYLQSTILFIKNLLSEASFCGDYPNDLPEDSVINRLPDYASVRKDHLVAIAYLFDLEVEQADGNHKAAPKKQDYANHILLYGNWSKIIQEVAKL